MLSPYIPCTPRYSLLRPHPHLQPPAGLWPPRTPVALTPGDKSEMAWPLQTTHGLPLRQSGSGGRRQGPGPAGFLGWRLAVGSGPLAAATGAQGAGGQLPRAVGAEGSRGGEPAPWSGVQGGARLLGTAAKYFLSLKTRYTRPLHPPQRPSLRKEAGGRLGGWS